MFNQSINQSISLLAKAWQKASTSNVRRQRLVFYSAGWCSA